MPKSNEVRRAMQKTNDTKQRFSVNSGKPNAAEPQASGRKKQGPHIQGVTMSNASNSAYTRAEKLLQFPDFRKTGGVDANHSGVNDLRDPYQGFTKVFVMPSSQSEYNSQAHMIRNKGTEEMNSSKHGKLGEILRDTHN